MGSNYQFKGFRSIDFMQQQKYDSYLTYDDSDDSFTGYEGNVYYFKHKESYIGGSAHADYINQACYNCLVQGSLFENSNNDDANKAYNTALARERYAAKKIKLPAKVDPSYYLYVEAIDKDTGEIITSGAEFNLIETGVTPTKIKIDNQNWSKKIDFNKEYTVDATSNVGVSDVGITDYGNYDAPKNTNASEPSSIESLYKSTSKITVSAGKIGNSIKVTYSGIQDVEKYGAGHGTGEYRNYGHE